MKNEIEKRLHRVKIELDKKDVKCRFSKSCDIAESSSRCNYFYHKCTRFKDFIRKHRCD